MNNTEPAPSHLDKAQGESRLKRDQLRVLHCKQIGSAAVAERWELSPRSREVAGSNSGRAKPKALKLVLAVSSLNAQHSEDNARTGWLGVRIMWLGGAFVACVCGTVHCWQNLKPERYRISCNKQPPSWYYWKIDIAPFSIVTILLATCTHVNNN